MSRLSERLEVLEAYLVSHYNPVLHPRLKSGRGGGEFLRKPGSGKLRDAVGEFAGRSGEWQSPLDRHMIDYEHGIPSQNIPPRSLSKTSQTEHIQRIFHGSTHVDYSETPFFKQLEALQGSKNPARETGEAHQAKRDALFAKQPVQMIPTKGLILTQPNVNRANVLREKPTVLADEKDHPAYAVKYGGKFYIVDGHHRLAAAVLDHASEYPARVLDLDGKKPLTESSLALPYKGSPLHLHFNPTQHPRGRLGQFTDVLGKLERAEHGSTVTLPRGIRLRRDLRGIAVTGGGHPEVELGTTHAAAAEGLFRHDTAGELGPEGHAALMDEIASARRHAAASDVGDVEHLADRHAAVRLGRRNAHTRFVSELSPEMFKRGSGGRVFAGTHPRTEKVLDKITVGAKDRAEMGQQDEHLNQIIRGRANESVGAPDFAAAMQKARAAGAAKKPAIMGDAAYVDVPFDKKRWPKIAKIEARSFGTEDFVVHQEGGKHPDSGSWGPRGHLDVSVGYAEDGNKVDNERIAKALDAFHAHAAKNPDWAMEGSTGRDQNARYTMSGALSDFVASKESHPTSRSGEMQAKLGLSSSGGRKNQATNWWLQNTPAGKRMLGKMGVAGYKSGPTEFQDLAHGDHFVYDSARPKLPGVHRKVGHHRATDEAGAETPRNPFDRVRKVPAPRGRKNEAISGVSAAQQNVLDYITAKSDGSFVSVPPGVTNNKATLAALVRNGMLEREGDAFRLPAGRKNEAVGGTPAWMKKPMTHEHIMAFLNGGPEGTQVTQAQYVAAKKDGLAGMLAAGAIVRPEHAAALEKAGYWPKQKGRK